MRSKIFSVLFAFSLGNFYHSQSNFPYEREWGNYVGATGNYLGDLMHTENTVFTDSQNNFYINGMTNSLGYSTAYYNQFVNGGGNTFIAGTENHYSANFSVNGQMLKGSYDGISNSFTRLLEVDILDNKYVLEIIPGQISNLATSGVWLTQNTNTINNYTSILTKYDVSNNVVWTTYVPNQNDNNNSHLNLRLDANQNIYLSGEARSNIAGLGTSGVLQDNFVTYIYQGNQMSNS